MSRTKVENLLSVIARHVADDNFALTKHARQRMQERDIDLPEITQILCQGWHEKRKDQYDEFYEAWNYVVRGKTVDKRDLRIVVTFDEGMFIVTAVDLGK